MWKEEVLEPFPHWYRHATEPEVWKCGVGVGYLSTCQEHGPLMS